MLSSLFKNHDNIIILDVETSGLDPKTEEIIEFGALRITRENVELKYERETNMLIRLSEGKILPPKITELTGITSAELLSEGVEKKRLADELSELFTHGSPLVVAYNAQFDMCFLYYFLAKHGDPSVLKNIQMLDALTVYKDRRAYPHRLENAVAEYAVRTKSTHRAIDDAGATLEVLCAMETEFSDLDRYINLFGYNPKYGVSGTKIGSVKYVPQAFKNSRKLYE